jgi:hypothetical protein
MQLVKAVRWIFVGVDSNSSESEMVLNYYKPALDGIIAAMTSSLCALQIFRFM